MNQLREAQASMSEATVEAHRMFMKFVMDDNPSGRDVEEAMHRFEQYTGQLYAHLARAHAIAEGFIVD